jgi:hypothetical protein
MLSALFGTSDFVGQKYPGMHSKFGCFNAIPEQTKPAGHGLQSVIEESPVILLKVPDGQGCGEMVA